MDRPIRIILADDHPVVRIGVRNMLNEHDGFEVVGEAADGDEAITQTLELQPDILLLDVTIPGASSREVFEEARRLRPETKVIIASAYTHEIAESSFQDHIEYFLRKPYRMGDLLQLIRQIAPKVPPVI